MAVCNFCGSKEKVYTCELCGKQFCEHCGDEDNMKCRDCVTEDIETREDQAESEQVEFGSEEKEKEEKKEEKEE